MWPRCVAASMLNRNDLILAVFAAAASFVRSNIQGVCLSGRWSGLDMMLWMVVGRSK